MVLLFMKYRCENKTLLCGVLVNVAILKSHMAASDKLSLFFPQKKSFKIKDWMVTPVPYRPNAMTFGGSIMSLTLASSFNLYSRNHTSNYFEDTSCPHII